MINSARALCEALAAAGAHVHAPDRTRLKAGPAAAIGPELTALLKRYKPELINALCRFARTGLSPVIAACPRCDSEFMHVSEAFCPWCAVTVRGPRVLCTGPATTVPTVPDAVNSASWDSWNSWDSYTGNRDTYTHVREKPGNTVPTVPPSHNCPAVAA